MATSLELQFPVVGQRIPQDHGYILYGALSERLALVHSSPDIVIGPILGQPIGSGLLRVARTSRLCIRATAATLPNLIHLAGTRLTLGKHFIRLGVPNVQPLIPAPHLYARLVTIKGFMDRHSFQEALMRKISELGIRAQPRIPEALNAAQRGDPGRRVARIKGMRIVGFEVLFSDLESHESLALLANGLGGRQKMGCGFFLRSNDALNT